LVTLCQALKQYKIIVKVTATFFYDSAEINLIIKQFIRLPTVLREQIILFFSANDKQKFLFVTKKKTAQVGQSF